MQLPRFLIVLPALASVLALVSSCAGKPLPKVPPSPPADLFDRADRPEITPEALNSEAAYETWRDDVDDWGKGVANALDNACWWFRDAGVTLVCRARPKPIDDVKAR